MSLGYGHLHTLCLHRCCRSNCVVDRKCTMTAATMLILSSWSVPGLLYMYKICVHLRKAWCSIKSHMRTGDVVIMQKIEGMFLEGRLCPFNPGSPLLAIPKYLTRCLYNSCSEWLLQRKAKHQLIHWGIKYALIHILFQNFS